MSFSAQRLFRPVDIASLVYLRIAFGTIMLWEVWRYLTSGWIEKYYLEPAFHFTYMGFGWVRPWPGEGMYWHFLVLGLLALFVILGFLYRLSAALFFLGFSYVFLLEQANYLNHFYLIILLSFLMIFAPAHRALSLDAKLRPKIRSDTAPAWALWMFIGQLSIVYFYAGVAKLNGDWLRGYPMRAWMAERSDFAIIGPLLAEPATAVFMSIAALFLDLLAPVFLLWRRTRGLWFSLLVLFHVSNKALFSIGVFPVLSIAVTALFFPPDWPHKIFNLPRYDRGVSVPPLGRWSLRAGQRATVVLLAVYFALQILVPLRHWAYPGNVAWNEEGHRFSWRMLLRQKRASSAFLVSDPESGASRFVDPAEHLSRRQARKMSTRPYMVVQYAHYLAALERENGNRGAEVYALLWASLNGREPQPLVDATVDLAGEPRRWLAPYPWITKLEKPLPTGSGP